MFEKIRRAGEHGEPEPEHRRTSKRKIGETIKKDHRGSNQKRQAQRRNPVEERSAFSVPPASRQ